MKNMKSLININTTKAMLSNAQYTLENMYVGDLSCMSDESDPVTGNLQSYEANETKWINPKSSFMFDDLIGEIVKSDKIRTVIHAITMSKFHKILRKSGVIKKIYDSSDFSFIWNYMGNEIIDNIDNESNDMKVVYLPKLIIPECIAETYREKAGNVEFNLIIIVIPDSYKDDVEDKRSRIVDTLQKSVTVAIFKKCRNLIIDISSISKNKEIVYDVIENMIKDSTVCKNISSVETVNDVKNKYILGFVISEF